MALSNVTTYGSIGPRTAAKATKYLLKRGQALLVTERFGQVDPQPQNSSLVRKWRRYHSLPRATAPLAEGVPPKGHKLTYSDYTATLEQFGDVVYISDVVADTHEDPVLREAMGLSGEQAAETVEVLRINVLKAGSNVFYANAAASRSAVNSPPTRGDFRRIQRAFNRDRAKEISEIISATAKVATEPVAPAFFALGHTDMYSDIRDISGFVPIEQYADSSKALQGEIGKIDKFRFILTSLFDAWEQAGTSGTTYLSGGYAVSSAAKCDVYPLICLAKDAYGIVPLQGKSAVKINVVSPGHPSAVDPLGQIGFASWMTYQACAILNEDWIARLECACTANPS